MAQSKVLIVEDDEGLREALVDTLALAGYEWLEADCRILAEMNYCQHLRESRYT